MEKKQRHQKTRDFESLFEIQVTAIVRLLSLLAGVGVVGPFDDGVSRHRDLSMNGKNACGELEVSHAASPLLRRKRTRLMGWKSQKPRPTKTVEINTTGEK